MNNKEAHKKVIAARTALVLDEPFWGMLATRLLVKEDPSCPTGWVDGKRLGYNPSFIEELSHVEIVGLVAHEVGHCAMGHPWRRDGREPRRWNEACDRALNPALREAGFRLPEGALYELDPSHAGKSAEWIYDRLPPAEAQDQGPGEQGEKGQDAPEEDTDGQGQEQSPEEGAGGQAAGQHDNDAQEPVNPLGEVRDAPDDDEECPSEDEWKQLVQQAAQVAKSQGKLPAGAERLADAACRSSIDWKSTLRRFAQETARDDYSWRRPNSRYVASGVYLPALHSEGPGIVAVAVDTSGSVDAVLLGKFEAEVQAIADEVQPREVRVLYCDARVHREETFGRGEPVKLQPCGGGGTDFRPVFRAIEDWDEQPECVVYLTDLWGTYPEEEPAVPVMWVTAERERREPPFGEVLVADQ